MSPSRHPVLVQKAPDEAEEVLRKRNPSSVNGRGLGHARRWSIAVVGSRQYQHNPSLWQPLRGHRKALYLNRLRRRFKKTTDLRQRRVTAGADGGLRGQRLAALVLDVASLEQHPPLLPKLIGKALEPVREQLDRLSDDLHNLAYNLHPSLLQHAGLQPAVEDHIREVTKQTGLSVLLKANRVSGSLPLDHSTCLFRVLQESLRNVVKHVCATEATVKLIGSSRGVGLSVTDNGKEFDANDKSAHHKELGLLTSR
jgi:signal transduction histidine kinase